MTNTLLLLVLLTPVIGGALALLPTDRHPIRSLIWLATPFISAVAWLVMLLEWKQGGTASIVLFEIAPNLPIRFTIEPLGLVFATLVAFLWPLATLYTLAYFHQNKLLDTGRFFFFFNVAIAATFAAALAGNLITLFIAYEILTLSTYPLVTHKKDQESRRAGSKSQTCLLYTSPSPRVRQKSRMPSSA